MHKSIIDQFPILKRQINGNPLIYFDNAATSQKPDAVIDAIVDYYKNHNANIHRGIHTLSEEATSMWINAHLVVADFINADSFEEIVFVRNSTEGLNLLVNCLVKGDMKAGDVVVISEMEHHSNIVPWQLVAKEKEIIIEWLPVNELGELDIEILEDMVSRYGERLKVISLVHQSNVLDSVIDFSAVKRVIEGREIMTILDVSQSITHMTIDVQELGCDFAIFSGHKIFGPTGSGVVYGKREYLERFEPWMGGGEMILTVNKSSATWNDLPWKFEAGTPDIAAGIGLAAALNWFSQNLDLVEMKKHFQILFKELINGLGQIDGVRILGNNEPLKRNSLLAFEVAGIHPHDIASMLDENGVAIRAGFHCAQPLHDKLNITASSRVSFAPYNTVEEVKLFLQYLVESIDRLR